MLKFPPIKGKSLIDYIVGQKYAKTMSILFCICVIGYLSFYVYGKLFNVIIQLMHSSFFMSMVNYSMSYRVCNSWTKCQPSLYCWILSNILSQYDQD